MGSEQQIIFQGVKLYYTVSNSNNAIDSDRALDIGGACHAHFYHYADKKENKMDVKSTVSNAKSSVKTAKTYAIKAQKGTLTLNTFRELLLKSPIPDAAKEIVKSPLYGDLILGIILDTIIPTITNNPNAQALAMDANIVGSMNASKQFTWIQTMVFETIKSVIPDFSFDNMEIS